MLAFAVLRCFRLVASGVKAHLFHGEQEVCVFCGAAGADVIWSSSPSAMCQVKRSKNEAIQTKNNNTEEKNKSSEENEKKNNEEYLEKHGNIIKASEVE